MQVDDSLLDSLKIHNAKCLQHLHKFSRGLTSAIIKENTILAMKYIEHRNKINGNCSARFEANKFEVRRRTYDDMLSGPESSKEGTFLSLPFPTFVALLTSYTASQLNNTFCIASRWSKCSLFQNYKVM